MAQYTDLLKGELTGVVIDSETNVGSYTPSHDGRLKGVKVVPGGIAATSLIENGYVKLTCKSFGGVDMHCPFQGIGLETVPRDSKPDGFEPCDLEIQKGVAIKIFVYYNVLPVTPELFIYGRIEG